MSRAVIVNLVHAFNYSLERFWNGVLLLNDEALVKSMILWLPWWHPWGQFWHYNWIRRRGEPIRVRSNEVHSFSSQYKWSIFHSQRKTVPKIHHDFCSHDDVMKWKHFPRYGPFVRRIHRSPVNSPHKGQWRGALMFSLICAWINGWINYGEVGSLRRHRPHYDVNVMVVLVVCFRIINEIGKAIDILFIADGYNLNIFSRYWKVPHIWIIHNFSTYKCTRFVTFSTQGLSILFIVLCYMLLYLIFYCESHFLFF